MGIPEPDGSPGLPNHVFSRYKVTNRDFTGHRRTDPDKPSPTILARGNGGGGVCAIQHPDNHRRMSIREHAWEAGRSGVAVPHGARIPRCDESGEGARDGRDGVPALTLVRGGAAEAPPRPRSRAGAPQLALVPPVDA